MMDGQSTVVRGTQMGSRTGQTAVSLVLSVFLWLKINFLILKMNLKMCSFSSRSVVLARQIKTQVKG